MTPSHVKGVNYPTLSKVYCVTMAAINRIMSSRHINITHTYLGEASIRKTIKFGGNFQLGLKYANLF